LDISKSVEGVGGIPTWVIHPYFSVDDVSNKTGHDTHDSCRKYETYADLLAEWDPEFAQDEDGKEEEEEVGSDVHASDPELEFGIVDAFVLFWGDLGECFEAPASCNGLALKCCPE